MQFFYTKSFHQDLRQFAHQKRRKELITTALLDFQQSLFASTYYRKKLQGYNDIHELQVGGDVRIIVQIVIVNDTCTFLRVGTHASLGLSEGKLRVR